MKKIMSIIKKEFLQVFRDRAMIAIIFVMPLIQLIILGYAISTDVKRIPVVICDLDNSSTSRDLIRGFRYSGYFNIDYYESDHRKLPDYLDNNKVTIAICIPKNYAKDLRRRIQPGVQLLVDGQDSNSSSIALGYANNIIREFSTVQLEQYIAAGPSIARSIHIIEPETRIWYNQNLLAKNYMVPGIIVLLLTIITTLLTAMGIVREKEIGTLEQLMVSPIKPYQLMIGKTVPFAILGLLEMTFAITVAKLWYNIPIAGNLFILFIFAIVFIFTTLGLGIFISTISRTQQQAMFLAWFIMVFGIIMSGFMFPIENMPKALQYLTYLNPVRYFLTVVRELFLKGSGIQYLWQQGVIMLIFSITIIGLSANRFSKRIK